MIRWEADVFFSEHVDGKTSPSPKGVAFLEQIDSYVRTIYNVIEQI